MIEEKPSEWVKVGTREEYLAWRAEWKRRYAALSEAIRAWKKMLDVNSRKPGWFQAGQTGEWQKAYGSQSAPLTDEEKVIIHVAFNKRERWQPEIRKLGFSRPWVLSSLAYLMLEELKAAKVQAGRDRAVNRKV